jgi:hypothetical protein
LEIRKHRLEGTMADEGLCCVPDQHSDVIGN